MFHYLQSCVRCLDKRAVPSEGNVDVTMVLEINELLNEEALYCRLLRIKDSLWRIQAACNEEVTDAIGPDSLGGV